jgi:hypothetical protein
VSVQVDVLRARGVRRDERQVDVVGGGGGEGDLGLLGLFLQALERHRVLAEVDAVVLLEGVDEPADEGVVPVVAAEVGVAVGGLHLEHAVADLEDETSKVPPPRSNTAIFSSFFLSRP